MESRHDVQDEEVDEEPAEPENKNKNDFESKDSIFDQTSFRSKDSIFDQTYFRTDELEVEIKPNQSKNSAETKNLKTRIILILFCLALSRYCF